MILKTRIHNNLSYSLQSNLNNFKILVPREVYNLK